MASPSMMVSAIGGKNQRRDVWKDTMEVPAMDGRDPPMRCNTYVICAVPILCR